MKDGETIKVVTLDKTSAEYQSLEKKFLDSVKNGIYNTGKAPNPANNPVGQFNKVKVNKVNCIQEGRVVMAIFRLYYSSLEDDISEKIYMYENIHRLKI